MVWTSEAKASSLTVDKDTKRRQLYFVNSPGSKSEQIISITEETDDKWQASLRLSSGESKNAGELFFSSEKDGYNHPLLSQANARSARNAGRP
jgi:hypothetical protein